MADLECYLCIASATSGAALNSFSCTAGVSLGTCFLCGVFACGHHALRNSSPKGWECVICVPSNITSSKPGRGGGPTSPTGGNPKGGPLPVSTYGVKPYTEEEFVQSYPTSSDLLRQAVRRAIADPAAVMAEYFGENYEDRVKSAFEIPGEIDTVYATHIAVALAVILFSELPDSILDPHLQRRREEAGAVTMSGAY
jgi:hypothetical protein